MRESSVELHIWSFGGQAIATHLGTLWLVVQCIYTETIPKVSRRPLRAVEAWILKTI